MKLRIILIGKTKQKFVVPAVEEYLKRCKRYVKLDEVVLSEGKGNRIREQEADSIERHLDRSDFNICLDENGTMMDTRRFARVIQQEIDTGRRRMTMVVGGAYGLHPRVLEQADLVLSLSPMTFPHQFVRAILYEQLYRAFTVMRNEPYHH